MNEIKVAPSCTLGTNLPPRKNGGRFVRDMKKYGTLYIMASAVVAFYILFHYIPMYGVLIAFQDFSVSKGIFGSEWVGFKHFVDFINNPYFLRVFVNTLRISVTSLVFSFPIPIIFALLLNELRGKLFPRFVQTIVYLPYFISLVVVCGLVIKFTSSNGIINDIIAFFGGERTTLLNYSSNFVPIYVISGIWQSMGWSSIIYLAAITGVDHELYDAATIDGADRLRQIFHVTIPGIMPTVIVLLILAIGSLMVVGFEKIMLLYNPITYETADVISTFVYRKGILESSFSFSTAVGLFNSVINFILLISANYICKKLQGGGIW